MSFNFKRLPLIVAALAISVSASFACGKSKTVHLFTTGDIHGCYFDSLYVSGRTHNSLYAVHSYVSAKRAEYGRSNVLLLDVGDNLQGDNASYYFNFVDTTSAHIFPRMASFIGYDAVVVGNHDIETGPAVYNRIKKQHKMPFLAANAIGKADGRCHFGEYAIIRRGGLKIAVIGFTNPNMRNWLSEDKLDNMDFVDPRVDDFAQKIVDRVRAGEKPDVVIVAIHAGSGKDSSLENCAMDLFHSLKGVNVVVGAHDHAPYCEQAGDACLINGGSHCRNVGHVLIEADPSTGVVKARAEICPLDKAASSPEMAKRFHGDFATVNKFSNRVVGKLEMPLSSREAYAGMSDYLNFLHTVGLTSSKADISFAAPLKFNAYVKPGTIVYDNLQVIYPFENQFFVAEMTGEEVVRYLEASYDKWINTVIVNPGSPDNGGSVSISPEHILKIREGADARSGAARWSFVERSYNFDSAGGIIYTVCVTAPFGHRVKIASMADGSAFDLKKTYRVAMTSYRYNGGGGLMKAAGVPNDGSRLVMKGEDMRTLIYDYIIANGSISKELIGNQKIIGSWSFTPQPMASSVIEQDLKLLFWK